MGRAGLRVAVVTIAVICSACRLATTGVEQLPAEAEPAPASTSPAFSFAAASTMPLGTEAPADCGFPPGTPLEYADRSTTSALDVQEVVGDPMSDDPADIYITRDKFDQGDLHGRLVCAIYVNSPGFVEVTVHPDDGGRFVPPTPYPSTTPPPDGISRTQAIAVARAHLDEPDGWEIAMAQAGPIGQMMPFILEDGNHPWAQDLSADRWVWVVDLGRGDRAIDVVIDYLDGAVLGTAEYIVN